jgi:hypothetical protein
MATQPARPEHVRREHMFFTGMAVLLLATVFAGFAPTYYLLNQLHGTTGAGQPGGSNLTPLVHVHAIAFSAWMLLFVAQTALIATHRVAWHRKLGIGGALLAVAMVVLGLMVAVEGSRLGHRPPMVEKYTFLIIPMANALLFGVFVVMGIANRSRSASHKRYMLLATMALLTPAIVRLHLPVVPEGPIGGFIVNDAFIIAAWTWDWLSNGRIHRVLLWGGVAFIASQPLRIWFAQSDLWRSFAAGLIG